MDRFLIVGASGQVGFAVSRALAGRGVPVRALVRCQADAARLAAVHTTPVFGDLADPDTLKTACAGVQVLVATANSALPTRSGDTPASVEDTGYANLAAAARRAGVRRFVLASVVHSPELERCSFFRAKFRAEEHVSRSGLDVAILRFAPFMDVAFSMMGSSATIHGTDSPTVLRAFPFALGHYTRIRDSIDTHRVAHIPGRGTVPHAFLAAADAAHCLVAAATGLETGTSSIGGPERLTFLDIVHIWERVCGHPLRTRHTPAAVFRAGSILLRPFQPAAARIFEINAALATVPSPEPLGTPRDFGQKATTAEAFLREHLAPV